MPQLDKTLFKLHFGLLTKIFLFVFGIMAFWVITLSLELRHIRQQLERDSGNNITLHHSFLTYLK